jgi:thymidylate synthase
MFHFFSSDSADDLWWQVACRFKEQNGTPLQASRAGPTAELLHTALELRNPRDRWITSRSPAINPAFALAEVVWIMRGRNDSAFLNYFNSRLSDFAGKGETYHGAYGYRLRHAQGFDQLDAAYQALKANPDTRQVVLQIWDGRTDFPIERGAPASTDVPCNVIAMLKIRNGRLEWTQIMRSNDLFLGFVHNVVQFTFVHEVIAGWLGIEMGPYHHFSDSMHLYERDGISLSSCSKQFTALGTDRFDELKDPSDEAFKKLENLIEKIIRPDVHHSALLNDWRRMALPTNYKNIACILLCEGLRRRGESNQALGLLTECTNPTYRELFQRWLRRLGSATEIEAI